MSLAIQCHSDILQSITNIVAKGKTRTLSGEVHLTEGRTVSSISNYHLNQRFQEITYL